MIEVGQYRRNGMYMEGRVKPKISKMMLFMLASAIMALAFLAYLYFNSIYPDSVDTDTFGHLFKSNYLYHSLKKGVW